MVKELRVQDYDDDYGYFDVKKTIGVNLSALWRVSKNEEQFIDYYSKVIQHEWLHERIFEVLWERWVNREEEIVERLSSTITFQEKKSRELYQVWKI